MNKYIVYLIQIETVAFDGLMIYKLTEINLISSRTLFFPVCVRVFYFLVKLVEIR